MVTSPAAFFPTLKGPDINESLFIEAQESGARLGAATPSTTSSLIQGGFAGVESGMSIMTGISNLESAAVDRKATTVNTEAQRQQNEIGALQNQAILNNKEAALATLDNKVKSDLEASKVTLEDAKNSSFITGILGNGNGEALGAILVDPFFSGTLARNPELAAQVIGAGSARGTDPSVLAGATASYDAVNQQKISALQANNQAKANAAWSTKNEQKYIEANAHLQGIGGFTAHQNTPTADGKKPDPANYRIYDQSALTFAEDGTLVMSGNDVKLGNPTTELKAKQGYVLAYGNQVINGNLSAEDATVAREQLRNFQSYFATKYALPPSPYNPPPGAPQASSNTQMPLEQGAGLDQGLAQSTSAPGTNTATTPAGQEAVDKATARIASVLKGAGANGSTLTNIMRATSQNMRQQNRVPFANSTQTSPQAANGQVSTLPVTTPTDFSDPVLGLNKVSDALGGAVVTANFDSSLTRKVGNRTVSILNQEVANRIESIPAVADKPSIFKGLVAIESRGNPNAGSPKGAQGLTQLIPGTAASLGVSPSEVLDPTINAEAGARYLEKVETDIINAFKEREDKYRNSESQINSALAEQSMPQQVDPRLTLLGYNGGPGWVTRSIRRGNTTFEEVLADFKTFKDPEAYAENSAYPDKVIAASLPFIKGGNASDDDYIQTLINFGIISVDFDTPTPQPLSDLDTEDPQNIESTESTEPKLISETPETELTPKPAPTPDLNVVRKQNIAYMENKQKEAEAKKKKIDKERKEREDKYKDLPSPMPTPPELK